MKREELIAYDKWLTRRKWGTGEIISPEKAADLYLAEHPLPPAEGAEQEKILTDFAEKMNTAMVNNDPEFEQIVNDHYFDLIEQPTAEGAEEIIDSIVESLGDPINIHNHAFEIRPYTVEHKTEWWIFHKEVSSGEPLAQWLSKFATLHAQKIADKMVEATKDCYPKEFVEWKDKKELRYSSLHNRYYSDTDNGMREFTLDELFNYWKENEQEEHPTNKEKFDGNYLPDPD